MKRPSNKQLQADCDFVDAIEHAHSRMMFALKDMGFEWKVGAKASISEYHQTYCRWANGQREEGGQTPDSYNPDGPVNKAIRIFQELWDVGERFIVWRIPPEITSDGNRKRTRYKLYMRWHTMREIPQDYLEKVRAA